MGMKKQVLGKIYELRKPVSLSDLLKELGANFKERTVRRWLSEMVSEGLIERLGRGKSTVYCGLTERPEALTDFSEESFELIRYVRQPASMRKPVSYNQKWVESYIPNTSHYLPKEIQNSLRRIGARDDNQSPAGTYARHIYNRLLIDISYNSSRLEGNTYSLLDTERLLIDGETVEGKSEIEKVMILNHKESISYLVNQADRIRIEKNTICTLHYLLSDGLVMSQYSGKMRDHPVRSGSSRYLPIEGVLRLERQLELICEKAADIINPYEQSFFLLVHIAYLQAFTDVNKRTSRLAANIPLIQKNLVPLSFNDLNKDDYALAMIAVYELNEVRPLLDLYRASYIRSCEEYDVTLESLGFDQIRVLYRQQRRELIRHIILEKLKGKVLEDFIQKQASKQIKKEHKKDFIEDVKEDIDGINSARIAGMGVTQDELNDWLRLD